jgi:hypothetical protein
MRTPRGLRALRFSTCSTRSGTITVRAQYDIFERCTGNHFGASMSSTGMVGTWSQLTSP